MCLPDTPSYTPPPIPTPPPPPQDAKQPEIAADSAGQTRRRAASNAGMAGSTLLTGPTGIETSALNLGKTSLLGA